ncbi:unnamed protein product [Owenia fusiformis]|uniref:Uncharacterized protein n=1 Tax=Owenia fusiformis TaxID=6347 RepID=A0A8J1T4V2_OWEFU|nr:unnamed protein product [Owenia fusiformis]
MATKSPTKSTSSKLLKSPSHANVGDKKEGKGKGKNKEKADNDQEEREGALAFKVLSEQKTRELLEVETVEEVQSKLVEILDLPNYEIDLKEAAILDYCVSAIWWGREQKFTIQQLSGMFTVVHTLLENIKERHLTVVENICEYKKMLVGIGQESPEETGGLNFFDISQAATLNEYLYSSLFQHYKLYEFMFTTTQAEEIIGTDLEIEVALPCTMPWPPPLDEGVSEEMYDTYITQPTPPPTAMTEQGSVTPLDGEPGAAEGGETTGAEGGPDDGKLQDLLATVTPDEIKSIMDSVASQLFGGLTTEVAGKLREKENAFINRINKIHKVADT